MMTLTVPKGKRPSKGKKRASVPRSMPRARSASAFAAVPQLDYSITLFKKIRFDVQAPTNPLSITNQNLSDLLAINVTGVPAQTYRLCSAVRLVKVSIYGASGIVSGSVQAPLNRSVEFLSSTSTTPFGGPSKILGATSVFPGSSVVSVAPPADSYAAQWINSLASGTSIQIMNITAQKGDIVDFTLELVINTNAVQTAVSFLPIVFGAPNAPIYCWSFGGASVLVPQYYSIYN
jgi:hypothetical protein